MRKRATVEVRLAFFGSPAYSVPALRALAERFDIALAVSQPDKPVGRGLRLRQPPVAAAATELGLRLLQPARLKGNDEFRAELEALDLDVAVTVAYGRILPQALLDVPRLGFLNAHASLLPLYRGAAPVQWALIDGRKETGVSIMRTEAGLDTGPVALRRKLTIDDHERAPALFERLSRLSAHALVAALDLLERGDLEFEPQDDRLATMAPMLKREDGRVDWQASAKSIYDRFRGLYAWPGSFFRHGERELKILDMLPAEGAGEPGTVLAVSASGVLVGAGRDAVLLQTVQPAGRPGMGAREWANGYGIEEGVRLA